MLPGVLSILKGEKLHWLSMEVKQNILALEILMVNMKLHLDLISIDKNTGIVTINDRLSFYFY